MKIVDALVAAQARLSTASNTEARFEAQLLLQHALKTNRAWLIAHENDVLTYSQHMHFDTLIQRRIQGEPIAYMLGFREFYGLHLKVTPDTLIPRPDTEILVDTALSKMPASQNSLRVLDLGTGSGAIALAIANKRPRADVLAIDASENALKIAQENANALQIANVQFLSSHWFGALHQQRFDVIVSNPPYIEDADPHLAQGDLRFEPLSALASGKDGLHDIRMIIDQCLVHLKPQGWLMLEHGYNQASAVADLMSEAGLVGISTHKDLGGNDRVTVGQNPLIVSTHWQ